MNEIQEGGTIWTIGHSTRSLDEFIEMLKSFQIAVVADIRRFPGSKKYPHFNQEALRLSLRENGIEYLYFEALGGRRKARPNSKNTAWRNASFQGYADYMETPEFKEGFEAIRELAVEKRTAYMCSEAVWWRCHRSMISDALKAEGWKVVHIMDVDKGKEHPYTQPARIVDGELSYAEA